MTRTTRLLARCLGFPRHYEFKLAVSKERDDLREKNGSLRRQLAGVGKERDDLREENGSLRRQLAGVGKERDDLRQE